MENEQNTNFLEKTENFVKENKNILLTVLTLIIFVLIGISYLNYYQKSKNEKISEKFVQAGIYLSLDKQAESKKIYEEIINSKNKFYSLLALNTIIDNNLEKNHEKVLELFNVVENARVEKEQKNLVKLKKALYLINISRDNEGKKMLDEIISDDSIWKETASEISKF
tara:strand:+ start:721 stop:1224 length:504 start_codon:yes stop_codon:yes gene_type:complete